MQAEITTTYCNEKEKKEEFDDTRWGQISARDRFFDLREEAGRNMTVFHKFPHIIKVRFVPQKEDVPPIEETHHCPCSEQHEAIGQ